MSGYDESLLKEAPEASRAERQKGYNIDLLVPDRVQSPAADPPRTPSAPPGPSFPPASGESEVATGTNGPGAKEYGSISQEEGGALRPDAEPLPFWRTTKGKLLISLVALIVIAAIVGGAVGGATSSKGGSKAANPSTTSSPAPISSSAWTSQPYASGGSTSSRSQPAGSTSVATEGGGSGSETTSTNSNNAQGPSTSESTITTTTTTAGATPSLPTHRVRRAFLEALDRSGAAADSSRDRRRRHPSPALGVAGAEVDD